MNNKNKNILVFGEGKYQGLDDKAITVEDEYSISFEKSGKRICFQYVLLWKQQFLIC